MTDGPRNSSGPKEPLSQQRAEALGLALASSLGSVTEMWERQMSTLLAMGSILAAIPQTADVDPRKVGAVIQIMSQRHKDPEKLRDEMTKMASMIIEIARKLKAADLDPPAPAPVPAPDEGGAPPT